MIFKYIEKIELYMSKKPVSNSHQKEGGYWLYGLHSVQAALKNPLRQKNRLLATQETFDTLMTKLERPLNISYEIVDRMMLDRFCGRDAVHQGVALQVMPLPEPDLEDIVKRHGPVLILDQVTDPRNVGAILRSAMAFGAAGIIMQDRHSPEESGVLAKAASGALDSVLVMKVVNLSRIMKQLKEKGFWVLGMDAQGEVLNGQNYKKRKVALVLGAEGKGLRQLVRQNCDEIVSLYMAGDIDSLNVSVAGAIALYEIIHSNLI